MTKPKRTNRKNTELMIACANESGNKYGFTEEQQTRIIIFALFTWLISFVAFAIGTFFGMFLIQMKGCIA